MKQIYSALLLFSFFAGIIQPVIPMAEYSKMNKKGLVELIIMADAGNRDSHFCTHDNQTIPDSWKNPIPGLLDLDYYPIPIYNYIATTKAILPEHLTLYQDLRQIPFMINLGRIIPPPKFLDIPVFF